ncbi:unnamed protein product [Adineta ricciae]|uniref:Uncharacterized protein n=1 Tax=Adineta ricciae TaxID=249248 RepID=A0A815QUE6_ADIRI|nr:unnamed protein product [Adineta ricciae]
MGLSLDAEGNNCVDDWGNDRILSFYLISEQKETVERYKKNSASYNRPKLTLCETWDSNAITFANRTFIGEQPTGIFINTNNTIFILDRKNSRIVVWQPGSMMPAINISSKSLTNSWTLFVNKEGDIHAGNSEFIIRKTFWYPIKPYTERAMKISGPCTGLFIDKNNYLYCSLMNSHRVDKINLNDETIMQSIVAAGTGCPGPLLNMLDHPHGIFVDMNIDLYVADTYNNRVQRFTADQFHGITVAGFGAQVHFILNRPTNIVLDADGYLFIVESQSHRIVRSIPNGFRCLVGCSSKSGTSSSQLHNPQVMAFDKIGNIYVTDTNNRRIQKFNVRVWSNGTYACYYYVSEGISLSRNSHIQDRIP